MSWTIFVCDTKRNKETVLIEDREYDPTDQRGWFQRWVWKEVEFIYALNVTEDVLQGRIPIPLAWADLLPCTYAYEDVIDAKNDEVTVKPASRFPTVLRRYHRRKLNSTETVLIEDREYDHSDEKGQFQRWVCTEVEFIYSRNITWEVLEERSKNHEIPLVWNDLRIRPLKDDSEAKMQQNITSMLVRLRREMS